MADSVKTPNLFQLLISLSPLNEMAEVLLVSAVATDTNPVKATWLEEVGTGHQNELVF